MSAMNAFAEFIGYAVMIITATAAVSALALWAADFVVTNAGVKKELFLWYAEKLRKQRGEELQQRGEP